MNVKQNHFEQLLERYHKNFPRDAARIEGFERIPHQIPGLASFPVSTGMYENAMTFPKRGVMFIGNSSDTKKNYDERVRNNRAHGEEKGKMKFWEGVTDLFVALDTALTHAECYFTNVYPALEMTPTEGERKPRRRADSTFAIWCQRFLQEQIDVMDPRLLVVLGEPAKPHVERIACGVRTEYISHPSYWLRLRSTGRWPYKGRSDYDSLVAHEAKQIAEALKAVN